MAEPALLHVFGPRDLPAPLREAALARAAVLKAADATPTPSRLRVGALFFNPSLRTRASFEAAVHVVGGRCQTLNAGTDTWALELDPHAVMDGGKAENVVEAARVLGQFFHVLGVRSFRGLGPWAEERTEPVLRAFAAHAGVPVVSLEGTTHHPCQSLADVLTLRETFAGRPVGGGLPGPGSLRGLPVALVWAWHPRMLPQAVPHSFLAQAALEGADVTVVHPEGYDLDPEVVADAAADAAAAGGAVRVTHDRADGLAGRKVVYVKSWGPLTPPAGAEGRNPDALRGWIGDDAMLALTDRAKVMHCLPVRRNVVLSGAVLDGPHSIVTAQAGNRLWAQAGLVETLARHHGVIP